MSLCIAIDAGGTLCKVGIYASPDPGARTILKGLASRLGARDVNHQLARILDDETLHIPPTNQPSGNVTGSAAFVLMPSGEAGLIRCVSKIAKAAQHAGRKSLGTVNVAATGGMVHKHDVLFKRLEKALSTTGGTLSMVGEFDSLVGGVIILLGIGSMKMQGVRSPFFTLTDFRFHGDWGEHRVEVKRERVPSPPGGRVLLVNIGTGTSIVNIEGSQGFERVGGSSLGGGTFMGLCRDMCGARTFSEALALAARGDSKHVDVLVGDIYGTAENPALAGLRSSTLASSFAKLSGGRGEARKEDIALAALVMVAMNVANIANLHARLHKRDTLLFTGSFLARDNNMARKCFAYATHFWSGGKRKAIFIQPAPYVGTMGALGHILPIGAQETMGLRGSELPGSRLRSGQTRQASKL
eukprot:Hpha_TRINITY_DN10889_c0_g1::TRINITY_DN10889_c0_g1_i1::g.23051::m.23051/K09680/coaW; type II pantothenate kinase